jgi:hypothetical protein
MKDLNLGKNLLAVLIILAFLFVIYFVWVQIGSLHPARENWPDTPPIQREQ